MKLISSFLLAAGAAATPPSLKVIIEKLKTMKSTAEEDQETDTKSYAKAKCWFDGEKETLDARILKHTKGIPKTKAKIESLLAHNGEISQTLAELADQLSELEQDVKESKAIHKKTTEQHDKDVADMSQAIDQMRDAITLLSAVGADQTEKSGRDHDAFMNKDRPTVSGIDLLSQKKKIGMLSDSVNAAMQAAGSLISVSQKRVLTSFLQAPGSVPYTTHAGKITGVLKNMLDTFETNLADEKETYAKTVKAYEDFQTQKAKEKKQILKDQGDNEAQLADNITDLKHEREVLKNAATTLENDQAALEEITDHHEHATALYMQHKQLRSEEISAIEKALTILTSDTAFDLFKDIDAAKTSFIQIAQQSRSTMASNLARLARRKRSATMARLAALVAQEPVKMPFATLFAEITKMEETIKEEMKADAEKDEKCADEKKHHDTEVADAEDKISVAEAEVTAWEAEKKESEDAVRSAEADIADTEKAQKEASDERLTSYASFVKETSDTKMGVELLKKVSKVLSDHFDKLKEETEAMEDLKEVKADNTALGGVSSDSNAARDYGSKDRVSGGQTVVKLMEDMTTEYTEDIQEAFDKESSEQAAYNIAYADMESEILMAEKAITSEKENIAELQKNIAGHIGVDGTIPTQEARKKAVQERWQAMEEGCEWLSANLSKRKASQEEQLTAMESVVKTLKATPLHQAAVNAREEAALGDCADVCDTDPTKRGTAKCQACIQGVSVKVVCTNQKLDGC